MDRSGTNLTGPANARKVNGRSTGRMEKWQEVPQPHEKLTQVYGKSCRCTESQLMLTEVSAVAVCLQKIPWIFRQHTECWWKVLQMHEKLTESLAATRRLTEVDGRSRHCMKSWQPVPWMHEKLTEVEVMSCGCTECWRKVPRLHGKLTEVDRRSNSRTELFRRSHRHMKSWQNFMEDLRMHGKSTEVDGRSGMEKFR